MIDQTLKDFNVKYSYILIVSIIPLLIWGPFFPDLIVSVSSLIFLFYMIKKKQFSYFKKKPMVIFFCFCAYCIVISIVVAQNMALSFESSLFYFRIGIFSCLIWYLIEQNEKILDYFFYALILSFCALVLDGYLQYFTGFNIAGYSIINDRVSSFFADKLVMGSYISRFYPLALAILLLKRTNKLNNYLIILLLILTSGLVFISGERTSAFFHILSLLLILFFTRKLKFIKFFIFFSFIIIATFVTLTNDNLRYRMLERPFHTMGIGINQEKKYIFTSAHDSLYRTAFKMFLDKPFFGHGPKMYRVMCKNKKYATGVSPCMTHPHNFYIQLLAETGIVGFLFLLSSLIYVTCCIFRQLKTILFGENSYLSDYQVCLLSCLLITLWPFSPNGNFFNNWLAICYSLPVGFYLHSLYGKNKEEALKE